VFSAAGDLLPVARCVRIMAGLGRMLILVGGSILIVGVVLTLAGKAHLPLGRLPGDISYRGKNVTFYFPLATSILLSIVLSLIFWFLGRR
jgi:DUF2905 family protein